MIDSSAHPDEEDDQSSNEGNDEQAGELDRAEEEVVEGEVLPDRRLSRPEAFSGPLPSPNVLDEYDHVVPGLKHDIVEQWKGETAHRHRTIDGFRQTDLEAMRAYYEGEKRGQILGFIIFLGVLAIAALSVVLDQPVIGVASLIAAGGGGHLGAPTQQPERDSKATKRGRWRSGREPSGRPITQLGLALRAILSAA